ncbi:hypothetical protein [Mycobacterium riyadhense]|uniref:hypothetical protein n=1 Tax=Mycobacterium riyadhense TaxID=486698 RepID=UPI0019500862|nr:hypothetical protein [Mycobacterium riyadhense]
MTRRQMYLGIAGLLLGVVGLFALYLPVYLNQFDAAPQSSLQPAPAWSSSQNTPSVRPNGGPMMDHLGLTQME